MSLFTAPTTWADGQELTAAQLNALTAAIAASANSIVNAQVSANAAISGAKIAANAITTSHINSQAVTLDKLGPGAVVATIGQVDAITPQTVLGTDPETTIATLVFTVSTRLGRLFLFGSVSGEALADPASARQIRLRIRDGSSNELALNEYTVGAAINDFAPFSGALLAQQDGSVPGAGTETYTVTAEVVSGVAGDKLTVEKVRLLIIEMA